MACTHIDQIARLQAPRLSQSVNREECTQCFDSQDLPEGIEVCLTCFNGGCLEASRHHARTHVQKSGHKFTLNVKRKAKHSAHRGEDQEPPAKMTKLSIAEEREEDKYEHVTTVKCWLCNGDKGAEVPEAKTDPKVKALIDDVMSSRSSAQQSEVQAWEEEILPCEHTFTLFQESKGPIAASGLAHCNSCDLKENLWLCLVCGNLGCGRKQIGGAEGNSHGLSHYEASGHGVSVKLGTITPEGKADIYCYICNDSKLDPDLASHLANFGINVAQQTKTEKSMTELQIEHNLKYDFSLTGEDGKALEPVFGPGLTGLANLGNSCYMASVLQSLFSLPTFQVRYGAPSDHAIHCPVSLPMDCLECQMRKVADGLLSGRYSHPAQGPGNRSPSSSPAIPGLGDHLQHPSPTPVFQTGLKPAGFKSLIGKGHAEFATMRQQDSEEFFTWLLTVLRRDGHKNKVGVEGDATTVFSYGLEQRLQCSDCKKVRYRVDTNDVLSVAVPATEKGKDEDEKVLYSDVALWDCVEGLLEAEAIEYGCPGCGRSVNALKQTKFASFPEVLVVHAKKFQLVNWVPSKLDIPVILPNDDILEFAEKQLGRGLQDGETELPQDAPAAPTLPEFNAAAMEQLGLMGFPEIRSQKALLATGNNSAEAAMEWLFAHMEDPDIDAPIQLASSTAGGAAAAEPPAEQVSMLAEMGFTHAQAKKALRETGGDAERAVEWLFNHPDDTGEEVPAATSGSESTSTSAFASTSIPGTTSVPVKYRLKAFVSHKGPSVHSGHYVAHIRVKDQWVLFNDEKVVKADEESVRELKRLAYLYIFEKV